MVFLCFGTSLLLEVVARCLGCFVRLKVVPACFVSSGRFRLFKKIRFFRRMCVGCAIWFPLFWGGAGLSWNSFRTRPCCYHSSGWVHAVFKFDVDSFTSSKCVQVVFGIIWSIKLFKFVSCAFHLIPPVLRLCQIFPVVFGVHVMFSAVLGLYTLLLALSMCFLFWIVLGRSDVV